MMSFLNPTKLQQTGQSSGVVRLSYYACGNLKELSVDDSSTHSLDYFMSYLCLSFVFQCINASESYLSVYPLTMSFPLFSFPLCTCHYVGLHCV